MKLLKWISFATVATLIVSCYPEKERSIADFDIVGTQFTDDVVWQDYKTYYLYDSVNIAYDTTEEKPDYPLEEATAILNTMKQNLDDYGWQQLTEAQVIAGDTPDVYIESSMWNSTVVGAIYYPGYGYPGYGWGYPGWGYPGYGYPGYGTSYYSYSTGTVMMHILDVKNYDFNDTPPLILWEAGVNGILSSSNSGDIKRVETAINQAFSQSAYLNIN